MEFIREHIEIVAKEVSPLDDEDYETGDGGNFDDTFQDGMKAGRIEFARILVDLYFKKDGV